MGGGETGKDSFVASANYYCACNLYGTNWPLLPLSPSALMQLPKASNERLMFAPSTNLTPRFWVAAALFAEVDRYPAVDT